MPSNPLRTIEHALSFPQAEPPPRRLLMNAADYRLSVWNWWLARVEVRIWRMLMQA